MSLCSLYLNVTTICSHQMARPLELVATPAEKHPSYLYWFNFTFSFIGDFDSSARKKSNISKNLFKWIYCFSIYRNNSIVSVLNPELDKLLNNLDYPLSMKILFPRVIPLEKCNSRKIKKGPKTKIIENILFKGGVNVIRRLFLSESLTILVSPKH